MVDKRRRRLVGRVCDWCGDEYKRRADRTDSNKSFCSRECFSLWQKKQHETICDHCGSICTSRSEKKRRLCGVCYEKIKEGYGFAFPPKGQSSQHRISIVFVCKRCGDIVHKDILLSSFFQKVGVNFCSKKCRLEFDTGKTKEERLEDRKIKNEVRSITKTLVRHGKIKKTPCVICGEEKVECHHITYDVPDKVAWLCRDHHIDVHRGDIFLCEQKKHST